jgi:predicted acyltransferase
MSTVRTTRRIASLDQFRGYTVAGMFLVNFVGSFAVTPVLLTHQNNFCSYADTIMPQFFFAVGFGFRLTFGRRAQTEGLGKAYRHVVRRLLGLALIALIVYTAPRAASTWQELVELGPGGALRGAIKDWFQTLMHIAVTSLWILPVIRSRPAVRIGYMLLSAALHLAASQAFYFNWVQHGGIDGGVLGFLAWTIPMITGTLACDAVVNASQRQPLRPMALGALAMMGFGWLLSCGTTLYNVLPGGAAAYRDAAHGADADASQRLADDPVIPSAARRASRRLSWAEPPFIPPPPPEVREENYWMMSQRAATLSYHFFGAGFSLAVYAAFYLACDVWGWSLGMFRTLGVNALIGYILHGIVGDAVEAFMPEDSPAWYVGAGFLLYFGITYMFLRKLEKDGIYLKL